ncbi:hypothetical protein SKAU_G00059000, partial [Synaphobranchus kaupii]
MGLLRIMMPPKFQLLAMLAFGVTMLFLENQIQKLEESRGKLGLTSDLRTTHAGQQTIILNSTCLRLSGSDSSYTTSEEYNTNSPPTLHSPSPGPDTFTPGLLLSILQPQGNWLS